MTGFELLISITLRHRRVLEPWNLLKLGPTASTALRDGAVPLKRALIFDRQLPVRIVNEVERFSKLRQPSNILEDFFAVLGIKDVEVHPTVQAVGSDKND
jgi:hypothetical protein